MQALGLVWGEVDSRAPDFREQFNAIKRPVHPGAHLMLSAWKAAETKGGFTVGRDIPSRALWSVLRNLAIYEPLEEGRDFRVRLVGTAFYRRFGRDITGERLSQVLDRPDFENRRHALMNMLEERRPMLFEAERAQGTRASVRYEIQLLPILAADGVSGLVLAGLFFHDWVS